MNIDDQVEFYSQLTQMKAYAEKETCVLIETELGIKPLTLSEYINNYYYLYKVLIKRLPII